MRTRKPPEERKAEILHAATTLITERGYKKVAMIDVANSIGVSKAALYVYYPTKDALFEAVVSKSLEAPLAAIKEASMQPTEIAEKLTNMLVNSFTLALYKPKPMIELINSSRKYAQDILQDHTQQTLKLFARALDEAQRDNIIQLSATGLSTDEAAELMLSCSHGAALGTTIGSPILPRDQMGLRVSALVHGLINGWKSLPD